MRITWNEWIWLEVKGEEDLSEKRKLRREIEVEKNTVTKVSDVTTRISGGWEIVEDHWKGDTEYISDSEMSDVSKLLEKTSKINLKSKSIWKVMLG